MLGYSSLTRALWPREKSQTPRHCPDLPITKLPAEILLMIQNLLTPSICRDRLSCAVKTLLEILGNQSLGVSASRQPRHTMPQKENASYQDSPEIYQALLSLMCCYIRSKLDQLFTDVRLGLELVECICADRRPCIHHAWFQDSIQPCTVRIMKNHRLGEMRRLLCKGFNKSAPMPLLPN